MQYSLIFILETYIRIISFEKCRRKFLRLSAGDSVFTKYTTHQMVIKFRNCSLLHKKRQQTWRLMSEETLDDNGALNATPRKTLRWLSHQPSVSKSHVYPATKSLRWKPYKFTFVHNLKEANRAARVRFCSWFCEAVCNVVLGPFLNYCTDEAWLCLNDYASTQNIT
jgi:hypothetical protein